MNKYLLNSRQSPSNKQKWLTKPEDSYAQAIIFIQSKTKSTCISLIGPNASLEIKKILLWYIN